jgi:para-nitrobenzyl esterase
MVQAPLRLLALCCLLAGPASLRGQGAPASGAAQLTEPVRIAGGLVQGTLEAGGVRRFAGIPFAAPPVGALRWREPQPAAPWKGILSATRFGPRCMQLPIFSDMVFRSNGMSEDCLYLNVWTPARSAARRVPVLVYFYGGGFVGGDGSELRYDGASMARHGIVVVTLNYRLGIFGFLAHPELTRESPHHASGNYGLLDQAAALRWVQRNIAAFGGDPNRITIGGESAGSISVNAQMASPLSRRLIAGAIGESGGMIHPTAQPLSLDSAEHLGEAFADSAGVRTLAALRSLAAESILVTSGRPGNRRSRATVDGYFLPATPAQIFAAGEQAHVPLLVGWNSEESSSRGLLGEREPTPENYAAALRERFGEHADDVLGLLPDSTPAQVMDAAAFIAGAQFIAYSTWKWADLHRRTGRAAVYVYLYTHPRPAAKDPAQNPPHTGAVHSAEIEYALGNLSTNQVYAWAPDDSTVSETMQAYFANFVRTGRPNGPGLPTWPAAVPGDASPVMILDVQPQAAPAPHAAAFRFFDGFYARHPGH